MSYFRILSLDGGGIRGMLTATILSRIEQACPGFLSKIDLFAGTSTGGLLALGFAYGFTPEYMINSYEQWGTQVFKDFFIDDLRDLGNLIGADYNYQPIKNALIKLFGGLTLGDLPKRVLISSFDLDNSRVKALSTRTWKAKFFHNFPGDGSDENELMVDVGIRTCMAPTFFPIYQGYIDGGVVANNPSVCALAQALHSSTGRQTIDKVALISLGTGNNPRYLSSQDGDWGLVQWAPHLIHMILEGSSGLADYQCRQFLQERYLRLNPFLPKQMGMDEISQISLLKTIGMETDITDAVHWITKYF